MPDFHTGIDEITDDLRERVAEAIWLSLWGGTTPAGQSWEHADPDGLWRKHADAAIAAYEAARPALFKHPVMNHLEAESLAEQVNRLAEWIVASVPGEPSQSQGAIDTAIRIMAQSRPTEPDPATIQRMARALFELDWEGDPEFADAVWESEREEWSTRAMAAWRAEHEAEG